MVRQIIRAYERARDDLLAMFMQRVAVLGPEPDMGQIRQLMNDMALIQAIVERLAELQSQFTQIAQTGLTHAAESGWNDAQAELLKLVGQQDVGFDFVIDPRMDWAIVPAMEQIPGLIDALRAQLLAAMRESLAAGDRFRDIAKALLKEGGSGPFPNGMRSAELMARRAVIQANNNARLQFMEEARKRLPHLRKRANAARDGRVTATCRAVDGQVRRLDQPFETPGPEAFARRQMQPPFHWNCRTVVSPYLEE